MLRITKAEDQAIRLAMRLAAVGEQLTQGQLAKLERLPEPTVAKLLGQLRRGGIVTASRGRLGGYLLARSPQEISAAQVLRSLGPEPAPDHPCVTDPSGSDCPRREDCGLRAIWRHLQQQVAVLLEQTSIADLLMVERSVSDQLQQHGTAPKGQDPAAAKRTLAEGA